MFGLTQSTSAWKEIEMALIKLKPMRIRGQVICSICSKLGRVHNQHSFLLNKPIIIYIIKSIITSKERVFTFS